MGSLISFLFHPFRTLREHRNDFDDDNIDDLLYHLSLFFAFGIYTVFHRYQTARNKAKPFQINPPDAADPAWTDGATISNAHIESHNYVEGLLPPMAPSGREYITSYDPATGLHLGTFVADTAEEIKIKIDKAAKAQRKWRNSSFADRRRLVRSLKKWLVENQEVCARVACRDTGKTLVDAALGEIISTCAKMDWLLNHGERYLRPETRSSPTMLTYKKAQVWYEPLGVVAAIVSWNYPLHNAWSPVLAALFAGNGVVLKCSEHVIWSTTWFIDVIKQCLRACDFDPEIVQLAYCYPAEAEALTRSDQIKHITFIGSDTVGRSVAVAATQHLTPVTLELGGKDPAIVLPGTDIDKWASTWMRGIFQNAGQNCIGIERLIVHSSQYEEVYNIIVDRARGLRVGTALAADGVGTGVDMGSMITSGLDGARFQQLEDYINNARSSGARVDVGGARLRHPYLDNGSFFTPTVVGDVTNDMRIAQNELFAPVAVLMPYDTIDDAIEIANGTKYALGASIFGESKYQCLDVAKRLECGMVAINDFAVFYVSQDLPFGGVKGSGYGRFGGPEGLRGLTNPKAVIVDRWPWLFQTSIPRPLDYPIRSPPQAWQFVSGLIGFLYADSWRGSLQGLQRLLNAN
ncbi:meiotic sister-chromatid recombination aldehyde dehydrogenase [Amylostereum chailletii]|nr:meiotic sister-chromatid recombination aldehyde dehydrogenase [Amylostereum chailletii]